MNQVLELARAGELPKTYEELVGLHVPRPIGDKVAYENTVAIVDALAGHTLNRDQEDYLEILSDLIEYYEEENLPALPKLSGTNLLRIVESLFNPLQG